MPIFFRVKSITTSTKNADEQISSSSSTNNIRQFENKTPQQKSYYSVQWKHFSFKPNPMCSLFLTSSTDGISRWYLILWRRYIAPRTSKFCQKCFSSRGRANSVDAILHVLGASLSNAIMSCQRLLHISIYIEHDVEAKFPASVDRVSETNRATASSGSVVSLWRCRYRWDSNNAYRRD